MANLVNTIDLINFYEANKNIILNNAPLNKYIDSIEKEYLNQADHCTVPIKNGSTKSDFIADNLSNVDVNKIKKLLKHNYYDSTIMENILCTMNTIMYLQHTAPGAIRPNERIKNWLHELRQIGKPSSYGYALESDLKTANDVFVIKSPKSQKEDLLHELVVGLELNKLRKYVPNFAYVFGGFQCTPPILKQEISPLNGDVHPVSWCDNSGKYLVHYILYENIVPSISVAEYVKSCTFEGFLGIYLQILFALLIAQEKMDFTHYDLHTDNVLIRSLSGNKVSIPYNTEIDTTEYLTADGIATIIDYGLSHLKLKSGDSIGVTGLEYLGNFYNKSSPLYDAYKLLMFSLLGMLINKNFNCYNKAVKLYYFFNMTELPSAAVEAQNRYLYFTPYTQKTQSVKLSTFINYIRKNIPEYALVMSRDPKTSRVLGCTGNDICVTDEKSIDLIGYRSPMKLNNIYDFYDMAARLEDEGRLEDIEDLIQITNFEEAMNNGIKEYNSVFNKILDYYKNKDHISLSICSLECNDITNNTIYRKYKDFLIETAEIKEAFQRLGLIYDSLKYMGKYYKTDLSSLEDNYKDMKAYYHDFLIILDGIREDAIKLGPKNIELLKLPELNILSKI